MKKYILSIIKACIVVGFLYVALPPNAYAYLDPGTGNMVFDLIQKLNQEQELTTVMVTHNHELAKRMNRCLSLIDGILHETILTT